IAGCVVPAATTPGDWQVVARIDASGAVEELDEDDNDRSVTLTVRPRLPDLQVTSLPPPATFAPGDTIAVPYTLANHGDADALTTTLAVYLSTDDVLDAADVELCRDDVSAPQADGTRNGQLSSCAVPDGLVPGPAWVIAVVDVAD